MNAIINNLPPVATHLPMYALSLVVLPLSLTLAIKICLSAKASSREKPKEWVLSGKLDADGIPLLATDALRKPDSGFSYAAETNRRSRR